MQISRELEDCYICASDQTVFVTLQCRQKICFNCFFRILRDDRPCPYCNAPLQATFADCRHLITFSPNARFWHRYYDALILQTPVDLDASWVESVLENEGFVNWDDIATDTSIVLSLPSMEERSVLVRLRPTPNSTAEESENDSPPSSPTPTISRRRRRAETDIDELMALGTIEIAVSSIMHESSRILQNIARVRNLRLRR